MYYDITLSDYPKTTNETSDSKRIMRAINDCGDGVLFIPRGDYKIDEPILIHNGCSVLMHKSAILTAVEPMDFVITIDFEHNKSSHDFMGEASNINTNINQFFTGGVIDGAGISSCLKLVHYRHFTLNETALFNGKKYGLYAGGYYELMCNAIKCKCTMNGLSGNIGIYSNNGDSHYTDCCVVDYTTGMAMMGGGSNRLTRCHIWGGPVKPLPGETIPEMLKNSICFHISSEDTILRECYADTAMIGFLIEKDARMLGCAYFNNDYFKIDNLTAIVHKNGKLLVSDTAFTNISSNIRLYEGNKNNCIWANNILRGEFNIEGSPI